MSYIWDTCTGAHTSGGSDEIFDLVTLKVFPAIDEQKSKRTTTSEVDPELRLASVGRGDFHFVGLVSTIFQ